MPTQHVLTLSRHVPSDVLDRVLTAVEDAYEAIDDSRTWIESTHEDIVVMAEVPATPRVHTQVPAEPWAHTSL